MAYRDIALMGRARSGKDSVAAHLVERHGYQRVAFADPLKEMALDIDPIVMSEPYECDGILYTEETRLSKLISACGWERTKDACPEARRLLQHMGQTVRRYDEDFWLNVALMKVKRARVYDTPVVVTDCRYPNEHRALRFSGFTMTRVVRPDRGDTPGGAHESETALDGVPADWTLCNIGTLDELYAQAEHLATH
jgi:hypothetical protein